jgi:hypothetical protein
MRSLPPACVVLLAAGRVWPHHTAAQGNSNGRPKNPKAGQTPAPAPTPVTTPSAPAAATPTTATATTSASTASGPGSLAPTASMSIPDAFASVATFRQFGSWLDDASAPTRGEGQTSIGAGYWRLSGLSQTNMPMLGAGVGLSDRLQVSASVPFYRVSFEGGASRGMDDVYVSAKYNLVDPALSLSEVGLSVGTVMEVLSSGAPGGRLHFAVPVSVEVRRLPFRVYGSAGFFTRGSVFSGGAIEWTSRRGLTVTGAVTQSYSLTGDALLDSLAVGRQRIDANGGLAYPLGRAAAAYGSIGRSLVASADGRTQLSVSGGLAVRFSAARPAP